MTFWVTLAAYELVWFAAVIGAGHGLAWPGVAGTLSFAAWRLAASQHRGTELKLIAVALLLGFLLETLWVRLGLIRYAAPWPMQTHAAWLMALWAAFALTVVPLFSYLHERPWLAAALGAVGGPLATSALRAAGTRCFCRHRNGPACSPWQWVGASPCPV
ncbi:MAG: DUF2878 family protein [Steroidobacteraceae bacterium]